MTRRFIRHDSEHFYKMFHEVEKAPDRKHAKHFERDGRPVPLTGGRIQRKDEASVCHGPEYRGGRLRKGERSGARRNAPGFVFLILQQRRLDPDDDRRDEVLATLSPSQAYRGVWLVVGPPDGSAAPTPRSARRRRRPASGAS